MPKYKVAFYDWSRGYRIVEASNADIASDRVMNELWETEHDILTDGGTSCESVEEIEAN